jgi:predicted DNA-binding mobile mystery protein A
MKKNKLQVEQLSRKLKPYTSIVEVIRPPVGWVRTIRNSFGMSLEQLGDKLEVTRQSAQNLEKREADGTITIKALEEAANALDMKLVYGFIPMDGSIEKLIDRKARKLATEIVLRTSGTMKLEDQENSPERIKKAIEERTKEIIEEMPKMIWD